MTDNIPQSDNNAYKSLLYWRKNLWNGSACVPVILTLNGATLSMKAADDTVVFSEVVDQLSVQFTGWGTMVLTVAGKKYDIVGMPAADSPAISELQKAELSGLSSQAANDGVRDTQPAVLGGTIATVAGPSGASVVGAAVSTAVYYQGLTSIREWKALIGSPADQKRKLNYMTLFIISVVIVVIGAIILRELSV
jgi:hypothetical protein